MRLKIFIAVVLSTVSLSLAVGLGFKLGVNARVRVEVPVSISALVRIHQSIESGDMREARDLTEMMLLSKIDRCESLKGDVCAKVVYGKNVFNSQLFQKHLEEAMIIRKSAFTNLVWIVGETTNSTAPKPK